MEFQDNVITELTAPNNVPFQPGFDIIGFGSEVPPEMEAVGFEAAIIFYTDDWDPAATNPRLKYFYIGVSNSNLVNGFGYSENPSTTPTATLVNAQSLAINNTTGDGLTDWLLRSTQIPTQLIARINEGPSTGGGVFTLYDGDGERIFLLQPSGDSADLVIYDGSSQVIRLAYAAANETLQYGTSSLGYGSWVPCTYANGWGPSAAPSFNRRSGVAVFRDPVGTVHLTGVAQGGTNANGTYCVQLPGAAYRPAFGKAFLVNTQNADGFTIMCVDSANGAITIAGPATSGETSFETCWTTQT